MIFLDQHGTAGPVAQFDRRCNHFAYLVQANDLTIGLLDLAQLGQEVPESTLGDHIVGCKDAHPVQLRRRVGIRRQMPSDNLVFLQATCSATESALSYGGDIENIHALPILPALWFSRRVPDLAFSRFPPHGIIAVKSVEWSRASSKFASRMVARSVEIAYPSVRSQYTGRQRNAVVILLFLDVHKQK